MDNCIVLKKPQIMYTDCGTVRLAADIIEPGKPVFHSFVEVEKEYEQYLSIERADWLLYLAFPVAIREGYDIVCEAPVTEMFLHNINEILIPHFLIGDSNAKKFKIHADTTNEIIGGNAVGAPISCGVDSLHTIMKYTKNKYSNMLLSHLFVGSVNRELWDFDKENDNLYTWEEKHKETFNRIKQVTETTGLPLIKMLTNIVEYVCWDKRYRHLFTHHWITISAVLSLRKLWKIFYFPSATDFVTAFEKTNWLKVDPEHMAVISMHVLALQDFHCYSGGASVNRIEKTRLLADFDLARKTLHPCSKQGKMNCSNPQCGKCTRALFALDYYDKLDEMKEVFDIQRYRDHKQTYFWHLASRKYRENYDLFYKPLYEMMLEKYPEEVKKSAEEYEHAYNVSLKLSALESPRTTVLNFFKEKGITKLYCSGSSKLGKTVMSIVENDIELVSHKTGRCSDCDAVYILSTMKADIDRTSVKLKTDKPIYTFLDIERYIEFQTRPDALKAP